MEVDVRKSLNCELSKEFQNKIVKKNLIYKNVEDNLLS